MSKLIHKSFFWIVILASSIVYGQTNPPCPPGNGPCGGDVDDVLPLEQDVLMIILAVALAVFYLKRKVFLGLLKKNS